MSKFIKMSLGLENKALGILEDGNGKPMTSIRSNINLLFETHFPGSKRPDKTSEEVTSHEATINYLFGE